MATAFKQIQEEAGLSMGHPMSAPAANPVADLQARITESYQSAKPAKAVKVSKSKPEDFRQVMLRIEFSDAPAMPWEENAKFANAVDVGWRRSQEIIKDIHKLTHKPDGFVVAGGRERAFVALERLAARIEIDSATGKPDYQYSGIPLILADALKAEKNIDPVFIANVRKLIDRQCSATPMEHAARAKLNMLTFEKTYGAKTSARWYADQGIPDSPSERRMVAHELKRAYAAVNRDSKLAQSLLPIFAMPKNHANRPLLWGGALTTVGAILASASTPGEKQQPAGTPQSADTQTSETTPKLQPENPGVLISLSPTAAKPKSAKWGDLRPTPIAISFTYNQASGAYAADLRAVAQLVKVGNKWETVDPSRDALNMRVDPASLTKIASFGVIMEHVRTGRTINGKPFSLDTVIHLSRSQKNPHLMIFDGYSKEIKDTMYGIEKITVRDALKIGMTGSNNAFIWAAALAAAGYEPTGNISVDKAAEEKLTRAFVNEEQELVMKAGATGTDLENTSGLPADQDELQNNGTREDKENRSQLSNNVTTVADQARVAAYVISKYPQGVSEFMHNGSVALPGSKDRIRNSDPILKFYPSFAREFNVFFDKTGTADAAGSNLVTAAKGPDGSTIITVVVGYKSGNRCLATTHLIQAAFWRSTGVMRSYEGVERCPSINSTIRFEPQVANQYHAPENVAA